MKDEIGVFRVHYERGHVVIRTAPMGEGAERFAELLKKIFGTEPHVSPKGHMFKLKGLDPWMVAQVLWHRGFDVRLKQNALERWRSEQQELGM